MYAFVGISGMAKMSSSKGSVPTPSDALEIMEPQVLRWLYARRKPQQSFTVAFDQEIYRLYDEWDALGRKVAAGTVAPFPCRRIRACGRHDGGPIAQHARGAALSDAGLDRRHHHR